MKSLVKMTLKLFQSISVVMTMVSRGSLEDQYQDTGVVCQLAKTVNFIATPMKKTYLVVYYLLIGDTSQVSVTFPDINKNE